MTDTDIAKTTTMPVGSYDLWLAELKTPTPETDRLGRPHEATLLSGFWRIEAAKTKPDHPVAIWTDEAGKTFFQIGRKLRNTTDHEDEWDDFAGSTWFHCAAAVESAYHQAVLTGFWPDNKPARQMDAETKLDIIPDTPVDQGGNSTESGPSYAMQIDNKMQAEIEKHKALGKVDTAEKATKAAAVLEAIRSLGKLGNARREADRAPHLAAAQAVQNVWLPILTPGSELVPVILKEIDDYAKAERARLQAIADEAARVERERLQAIADEDARIERDRLQKLADDEAEKIGAVAEQVVVEAEQIDVVAEEVAAPKVSTQFGRAVSKAKRRTGKITNRAKFITALNGQSDFSEWLQDKADKLARANLALDGMEIVTE